MIPLAAFALAACLAVQTASDHILAGDLAVADSAWSSLPPDTPLALAPAPGVRRILGVAELRRMAQHWKLDIAPAREVCFTRPAAPVDPERVLSAMRRELPEARIEMLETSRQPAPEGELQFPLTGLRQTPAGGYWTGYVLYAGKQRFAVWARVKVRVTTARVMAAETLAAGVAAEASQLRVETGEELPHAAYASEIGEIAGRVPRRTIPAGTPLRTAWFEAPKAVFRGETVRVKVMQGGAQLSLEGVAQAAGAVGDRIPVENPQSHRRFTGRIAGRGQVEVKGTL